MSARRTASARGFTLLEVMAAVLVLGMLYAVLANAAMRGLRSEGDSKRRIQASLLADLWLAERELELSLGQIPKSGQVEEPVDGGYVVDVTVGPFDPTILMAASEELARKRPSRLGTSRPASSPTGTPGAAGTGQKPGAGGAAADAGLPGAQGAGGIQGTPGAPIDPNAPALGDSLLTPPGPGQEGRLRRIDIAVRWQEGNEERRVTRTTFAFDTTGLEQLFPKSGGEGEDAGAGEGEAGAKQIEDMLKQLGGGGSAPDEEAQQ